MEKRLHTHTCTRVHARTHTCTHEVSDVNASSGQRSILVTAGEGEDEHHLRAVIWLWEAKAEQINPRCRAEWGEEVTGVSRRAPPSSFLPLQTPVKWQRE